MTVMMISTTREGTHGGDLEHRFHPASPHEKPIRYNSRTATTDDHARWPLSSDAAGHRPGWPVRHPQGFDVIDEQQPSFLFERSVLVTGEVRRTTGYEPGLPPSKGGCTTAGNPTPSFLTTRR
jgi:hypothetical protein